jgi:hypothetical protein
MNRPVHYMKLQSVEDMREAYRARQRRVFNLNIIFAHSVTYRLNGIADAFGKESKELDTQDSLKTGILP